MHFPDHATLTVSDLNFDESCEVMMTEKDAVKCRDLDKDNLWYIPVDAVINDAPRVLLIEQIETLINDYE